VQLYRGFIDKLNYVDQHTSLHLSDLFLSDQPLDMDAFLQSDLLAAKRNSDMKVFIDQMTPGSKNTACSKSGMH
jgi:hypothetical protein